MKQTDWNAPKSDIVSGFCYLACCNRDAHGVAAAAAQERAFNVFVCVFISFSGL